MNLTLNSGDKGGWLWLCSLAKDANELVRSSPCSVRPGCCIGLVKFSLKYGILLLLEKIAVHQILIHVVIDMQLNLEKEVNRACLCLLCCLANYLGSHAIFVFCEDIITAHLFHFISMIWIMLTGFWHHRCMHSLMVFALVHISDY